MTSKVKGSQLYGAMVIAMEEALKLGRASEVYIDPPTKKILGISFKTGVLGTESEIYVGFEDILKFSSEMIIISNQSAGKDLAVDIESLGLRSLKGSKITTLSGEHIAVLSDVVIDRADGNIVGILLPQNLKLEIDIGDVVFGHDLIMVPADYMLVTTEVESESRDFINKVFGNTDFSERVRNGFEEAKSSMRQNVNREKVVQSLKSGSRVAKDTITRTSQAIQHKLDQIMKKRATEKSDDASAPADVAAPVDADRQDSAGHSDNDAAMGYESKRD